MSSLVLDLQREALDPKIGVADLLRKAYVVAVKLGLDQFKEWLELELNGYVSSSKQSPDYRQVAGVLKAFNPYNGFIPLLIKDANLATKLSHRRINSPMSEIEAIANDKEDSHVILAFAEKAKLWLMRNMGGEPYEPSLHVARTAFARIGDSVRNAVLKWSLELEKDGIKGDGMSFSPEEKKIAAEKEGELARIVNINIIGTMTDSSLQQGSAGARQDHQQGT
jgi:hypothetical protein